ncbi:MAG: hypothetical protein RLZZ511_1768 [Cyanobacteriota bacterium]|jgi:hypothetical protein
MNSGMTLQQRVEQQRVKHIIESFQLAGPAGDDRRSVEDHRFAARLDCLFADYPSRWLELAIAEVLVLNWLVVPLPRGLVLLQQVQNVLQQWQQNGLTNFLSEAEFQRITGLDPTPVFYALRLNALLDLEVDRCDCESGLARF